MDEHLAERSRSASEAKEEEIALFVHDPAPQVIKALLENPNLNEDHILVLANRKNLPGDVLESIFRDKRWSESYRVRLALAKNPKTPLFTALSIARFLRLFDLAEVARNHHLPVLYRKKLEAIVIEKIPTLPLGVKKTLAKIAAGDILLALVQDGFPDVVRACLGNPALVEAHLYKVINRKTTTAGTIRTIAEHRAWCCRYQIKFALIRNEHTPLSRSALFLSDMKLYDLMELYRDPILPPAVRPAIHRELVERGLEPEKLHALDESIVYEVDENDDEGPAEDTGKAEGPTEPETPLTPQPPGKNNDDRPEGSATEQP